MAPTNNIHVVSSHWNEDLEWLDKTGFTYSVCDKLENPHYKGTGECDTKVNRGKECSSYLQYITAHYDDLPQRVAFVHGHDKGWHQQQSMSKTLKCAAASPRPFQTLNGTVINDRDWNNAIPSFKKQFPEFSENEDWMALIDVGNSDRVISDCCAQFLVDAPHIQRLPLEAWESLHREVIRDDNDDNGSTRIDKCKTLERMWSPLFGMPAQDSNPMASYACTSDLTNGVPLLASTDADANTRTKGERLNQPNDVIRYVSENVLAGGTTSADGAIPPALERAQCPCHLAFQNPMTMDAL